MTVKELVYLLQKEPQDANVELGFIDTPDEPHPILAVMGNPLCSMYVGAPPTYKADGVFKQGMMTVVTWSRWIQHNELPWKKPGDVANGTKV